MSEEAPKPRDDSKVKLIGFAEDKCAILSHVPGWYGEACGQGKIKKVKRQNIVQNQGWCLEVTTPTKTEYCRVGDVIRQHLNGGLFVRHFSQDEKETT